MIRVVIADDQELVRSGLQLILEARGCEVVGLPATAARRSTWSAVPSRTWSSWTSGCP